MFEIDVVFSVSHAAVVVAWLPEFSQESEFFSGSVRKPSLDQL
jgi:hypothetical protein